jgi:hypothetical protein
LRLREFLLPGRRILQVANELRGLLGEFASGFVPHGGGRRLRQRRLVEIGRLIRCPLQRDERPADEQQAADGDNKERGSFQFRPPV